LVTFLQIPNNRKVPAVLTEFATSSVQQGASIQPYKLLILGQKLAAGTGAVETPFLITSLSQAKQLFGLNSDLAIMIESALLNNNVTEMTAISVADGGGASAAGVLTVATGTATENGEVILYVAGRRIVTIVSIGDDQDAVASAITAAITAFIDEQVPVVASAGASPNLVDIDSRHAGLTGNTINLRFNYLPGEKFPDGIVVTVSTPMAGGTTNPSLTNLIAAMANEQYNIIAMPWTDASSLSAMEAELKTRFGPLVELEGMVFVSEDDTVTNLKTLGNSRNSQFVSVVESKDSPSMPLERAAGVAGIVAKSAQNDPGLPFQNTVILGIRPPALIDQITANNRDLLLNNGIATTKTVGNNVLVERLVTTREEDDLGNPDDSFLDSNVFLILSFFRFDTRTALSNRFPNFKLAKNGTRIAFGSRVVTPDIVKAEILTRARIWLDLGLLEDIEQFKADLFSEISITDPNRVDVLAIPNLINQLRIIAVKFDFIR